MKYSIIKETDEPTHDAIRHLGVHVDCTIEWGHKKQDDEDINNPDLNIKITDSKQPYWKVR